MEAHDDSIGILPATNTMKNSAPETGGQVASMSLPSRGLTPVSSAAAPFLPLPLLTKRFHLDVGEAAAVSSSVSNHTRMPPATPAAPPRGTGHEPIDARGGMNSSVYMGSRCTTDTFDTDLDSFRGSSDHSSSSGSSQTSSRRSSPSAGGRGSARSNEASATDDADDDDELNSDEERRESDSRRKDDEADLSSPTGIGGGGNGAGSGGGGPTAATSYIFGNPVSEKVSDLLLASNRLATERHRDGEGTLRQSSAFMDLAVNEGKVSVSCMSFSPNQTNAFVLGTTTGALLAFADLLQSLGAVAGTAQPASTLAGGGGSSTTGGVNVARKITILDAHRDVVTDLVWAPPIGDILLSLSLDAFVIVWDMRRLNKIRQISTTYQPLVAAFLPKNSNFFLVGLRRQSTIRVYNLSTGICVRKVPCGGAVGAMAVDHTGGSAVVLTGDARGELAAYVYPMATGEVIKACSVTVEAHFPVVSVSCQSVSAVQRRVLLAGVPLISGISGMPKGGRSGSIGGSSSLSAAPGGGASSSVAPSSLSLAVLVSSRCDVISLFLLEEIVKGDSATPASGAGSGLASLSSSASALGGGPTPLQHASAYHHHHQPTSSQYYFVLVRRVAGLYRIRHFNAKSSFCEDSWHSIAFVSGSEDGTVRIVTCGENGSVQTSALLRTTTTTSASTQTTRDLSDATVALPGMVCTAVAWAHGSTHLVGVTADGRLISWPRIVVTEDWSEIHHMNIQHQEELMQQQALQGSSSASREPQEQDQQDDGVVGGCNESPAASYDES